MANQTKVANVPKAKKPTLPPPFVVRATDAVVNWLDNLKTKMMPPSITVLNKITGYWTTQFIHAAAQLKIADHLSQGPLTCQELAAATGANEQVLYRLMRALASQGIFAEDKSGRFKLNSLGKTLRSDVPGSMYKMAIMNGLPFHWQVWGNFLETVKTGQSGFERTFGMDSFTYFNQNPADDAVFNGAMTEFSQQTVAPILAAYDFAPYKNVADVAGGEGSLLSGILQAYPQAKGLLFDRLSVIQGVQNNFKQNGLGDRVELVSGDFFEKVPSGCDVYIMKNILHDFSDEKSIAILKKCREVMTAGSRLLIIENIIPAGNQPFPGKLIDLEMLMMTPGGQERSLTEYAKLFEATGFKMGRVVPTISPMSIIEALPS